MRSNTGKRVKTKTGKSNLDIVRSYLAGEKAFVQIGYSSQLEDSDRKEGSEWTDSQGVKWIKKNGYRQRVSKAAERVLEQRCVICDADMKWGNYLDNKIYPKTQRCYDCNIIFESILKIRGVYDLYEKYKVVNNEYTMLKDFKSKIVESIEYLKNYTPQSKDPQFFNEDGSVEVWMDDTDRRSVVLEDLNKDLLLVNEKISLAEKELKNINYDPKIEENIKLEAIKRVSPENK